MNKTESKPVQDHKRSNDEDSGVLEKFFNCLHEGKTEREEKWHSHLEKHNAH